MIVLGQKFCLHIVLRFIPFELIFKMTTLKNIILTTNLIPVVKDKLFACMLLYTSFPSI